MATFYLDPEGGNDANDGTTFANRWKTVNSGATAARTAPGDVIRVIASPPKTNTGVNATWTNLSATVTLSTALNALITDCESAWTASANVTATVVSSIKRSGTNSANLAIAAGFTTGKVAYFDLGSNQDYSGYQGITFWLRHSIALPSGFEIRLCSDTIGDVAVNTIAIPAHTQNITVMYPVYLDTGAALGSAIRSIALYATVDPGTITLNLDNISTVKAKGASQTDNLNLLSLLSKDTTGEMWHGIRSINGTTVVLDNGDRIDNPAAYRGYYGTTETVALYKWEPVQYPITVGLLSNQITPQENGAAGLPITYSGGWNRSDMSVQNGETWLAGSPQVIGWNISSRSYVTFEKINMCRWYRPFNLSTGTFIVWSGTTRFAANASPSIYLGAANSDLTIGDLEQTTSSDYGIYGPGITGRITIGNVTVQGSPLDAISLSNTFPMVKIGAIKAFNCASSALELFGGPRRLIVASIEARNCGAQALDFGQVSFRYYNVDIGDVIATNCQGGIEMRSSYSEKVRIKSLTTSGNTVAPSMNGGMPWRGVLGSLVTAGTNVGLTLTYNGGYDGPGKILASSLSDTTPRSGGSGDYIQARPTIFKNYLGVTDSHRLEYGRSGLTPLALVTSETGANRHTASGLGWKLAINSSTYISATFPLKHKLGRLFCLASSLVTVRLWVNRSNVALTAILVVPGQQILGVTNDVTDTAAASASTWEELEVTFTPSDEGWVDVYLYAYGGSSHHVFFDDITVIQA